MLEQLEEMQTHRVFQKLDVLRFLPILKVVQVVDKLRILEVSSLSQEVQIVGIAQTLDELEFDLKSDPFTE